jgi:hypothetical protein
MGFCFVKASGTRFELKYPACCQHTKTIRDILYRMYDKILQDHRTEESNNVF